MIGLGIEQGARRHNLAVAIPTLLAAAGMVLTLGATAQVAVAKATPGVCGVTGQVSEHVFTRVAPASGSVVHPGDPVGADFHDETQLNTQPAFQLVFTLRGPSGVVNLTPTITDLPAQTGGTSKEFKIVKRIRAALPVSGLPGNYSATITGFDSDQTRPGADCGTATWSFQVIPAPLGSLAGDIVLCGAGTTVSGGTIAAAGPVIKASTANPVSYPSVPAGSYIVAATAPSGYHFVACRGNATIESPTRAKRTVVVPDKGTGVARFLVALDASVNSLPSPTSVAKPSQQAVAGAVLGAQPTLPSAGLGGLLRTPLVALVLVALVFVLLGAAVLAVVRRGSRPI